MSDLNIGIVGMGWVAGAHVNTFKQVDGANVTAASSRRQLDEDRLEAEYGIPIKAHQEYEDLLNDESVDVIDICSPHPFHVEQAIAAAKAGKHLLIEKPIALSYEELKRLRDVIHETGVNAAVCFEIRYSSQGSTLHSIVEQGLLGDIHYGEIDYQHGIGPWYGQFPWNVKKDMGGSSLLTAGGHALDLLLWYMESEVEEVTTYGTKTSSEVFEPYEYDTTTVTILKFKNGSVGKVASVIDCFQPYYFHMHLFGSEGSVLDNKIHSNKIEGLNEHKWSQLSTPVVDSGDVADHPYRDQFQSFVDSIKRGEPMPRTDFDTAFETHRVIFAADRSAEENRSVKLSEFEY